MNPVTELRTHAHIQVRSCFIGRLGAQAPLVWRISTIYLLWMTEAVSSCQSGTILAGGDQNTYNQATTSRAWFFPSTTMAISSSSMSLVQALSMRRPHHLHGERGLPDLRLADELVIPNEGSILVQAIEAALALIEDGVPLPSDEVDGSRTEIDDTSTNDSSTNDNLILILAVETQSEPSRHVGPSPQ